MAPNIARLGLADYAETIDFLNMVFSQAYVSHDFERLLPKLYRPQERLMNCNVAVRESGRLRGLVGVFPMEWQVGDTVLRVAGIGGVSTHPTERGKGLMTTLMRHCVDEIRAAGYHLSYLGGQRQRYATFGYEVCGNKYEFTATRKNFKAFEDEGARLSFERIDERDETRLAAARALHARLPVRVRRPAEEFHVILRSWYGEPHAALDATGRMVGYLVAGKEVNHVQHVHEVGAPDPETARAIIGSWVQRSPDALSFYLTPVEIATIRRLSQECEGVQVVRSGNWQVIDWPAVLDAFLKARVAARPAPRGAVTLAIEGGVTVRMEVGDQTTVVACREKPDIRCDALTAMRLLFGPLPPSLVLPLPPAAAALESWCPLPLAWSRVDSV